MTQDEKLFFRQLGARIAQLRKERGLTQVQLAQLLDLTQQMVASYEAGKKLLDAMQRLRDANVPPLTEEDIDEEVDAARTARKGSQPR